MSNSYKFYSDTKDIMKKYVNATEGAIIYGISKSRIMVLASEAGAVYKVGNSALINTEQSSFFYPSIGLSGVISEMVKLPKAITYLKVRGSFASVGAPIPKNLSSNKTYEWDPATSQWKLQTYRPLPKLYPERTNSWEAGLNAKFFNNANQ